MVALQADKAEWLPVNDLLAFSRAIVSMQVRFVIGRAD